MRYVKISKFLNEKERVNWLVEGLLPDVGWTLFYGLKGIGKTTFAIQLCEAIQEGKQFLERETQKTRILYIQADSQELEWREILKRVSPSNEGFTVVDVPMNALNNPYYINSIDNFVSIVKPQYIIWDSLYALVGDNINTTKALQGIETMERLGKGVPFMVIHHPPHGESRAAGSSSLGANCSNEWCLLKTKLRIDKGRLVALEEIPLYRDKTDGGLWHLYKTRQIKGESFMDREI